MRIRAIVIDAARPAQLARFWEAALRDYAIRPYDDEEIARLASRGRTPETDPQVALDGPGPTIFFQEVPEPGAGRSRLHLDVEGGPRAEEVARLCALGARVRDEREGYSVLLDPEGNAFCVLDPEDAGEASGRREPAGDVRTSILGEGDAEVLERVAADVFDEPVQPALAREFLADPRHHLVVAVDGDRVVGFASGFHYVHPDKPPELFVAEVGVAPSHQRRGVARRLLGALLDHARSLGCREAWVGTELANRPARGLYAAVGGREDPPFALFTFDLEARPER